MRDFIGYSLEEALMNGEFTAEEAYRKFKNHEFTLNGHKLEAKNAHNVVKFAMEQINRSIK